VGCPEMRLLLLFLVAALLLLSADCGAVFFGGAITTGSTFQGTVSIVQLTAVNGNTQVTAVTFLQNGFSSTMNFCGDQIGRFPLTQTVQVNFNLGSPCSTILLVVIIG
jgi:Flp pilus assembly protein TadG